MTRLRLLPFLLLSLCVACDCGDDDDGGTETPAGDLGPGSDGSPDMSEAPEPLDAFAADYAAAYCGLLDRCYGPAASDLTFPNCPQAIEAEIADALVPTWRAAEDAGYLTIDAARADECVEALAVSTQCADLDQFIVPGCVNFLAAGSATGEACLSQQDCPLGAYCDASDACPGTCTTYAAVGASCAALDCAPGAYCDETSTCIASPVAGEACELDTACAGLLFCSSDGDPSPSCRSVDQVFTVAEGMPCMLSAAGPYCATGLSCVVEGGGFACRATVGSGEACSFGFPDPCPAGESCAIDDEATSTGTCTAAGALGESCVERPCGPGLVCGVESGTCLTLARLGESCSEDSECGSIVCEGGTCAAPECTL